MKKYFLFFTFCLITFSVFSQREIPELWGTRVHDEAKVLSAQTISQLEAQLKIHEDSTSNQIAILIIPSLNGEAIEDYSLRVAEKWKLGQEGKDNGVLILVAIEDHKMRIETGYGLEGVLPDAICNQIIRNEMAPNFRRGDFDSGVIAAVNAITRAIAGEYEVSESTSRKSNSMGAGEKALTGIFILTVLGFFTFSALATQGCAGWGLYGFLALFWAIFPGVVFGGGTSIGILGTYLIGFPILKILFNKMGWAQKIEEKRKRNRGSGGSSWSSGSGWFGGGGFGGGDWGGGGGGFSGGGGSFGGGGSSGSW